MPEDLPPLPRIADLHERHYGLTEALARSYAEAAAVCLQRHHTSPKEISVGEEGGTARDHLAVWTTPTERQHAAWANIDDATRDGAYGVVIAAAEAHFGYFVVGRARTGSGSDYLFSTQSLDQPSDELLDLQESELVRLEVSGIDRCTGDAQLDARLQAKLKQVRDGRSALPGMAGVVAFNMARVKLVKLQACPSSFIVKRKRSCPKPSSSRVRVSLMRRDCIGSRPVGWRRKSSPSSRQTGERLRHHRGECGRVAS